MKSSQMHIYINIYTYCTIVSNRGLHSAIYRKHVYVPDTLRAERRLRWSAYTTETHVR